MNTILFAPFNFNDQIELNKTQTITNLINFNRLVTFDDKCRAPLSWRQKMMRAHGWPSFVIIQRGLKVSRRHFEKSTNSVIKNALKQSLVYIV